MSNEPQFVLVVNDTDAIDTADRLLHVEGPGTQEEAIQAALRYAEETLNRVPSEQDKKCLEYAGCLDLETHILSVVNICPFDKPASRQNA